MKKYAIIVAGGIGSRMNAEIPKQFLPLQGRPLLMHTLEAFHNYDSHVDILLILPKDHFSDWQQLIHTHDFQINHQILSGGDTRFDSVKNGLRAIDQEGLVAIHDGARPLISAEVIHTCYETAALRHNAIAAVKTKDSLRRVLNNENHAVDRSEYYIIQTPQTFDVQLIKQAFATAEGTHFTDDASVLENYGAKIYLVEGDYANLKITTPEDMIIAEAILACRKK
ncbi:2-C-methyl-D-erythritol 4-phosphate cytidylyltransferase [Reichenbachiella agarivorans]|uniref:2-C-methyl-D-erythritol 4-phosphate cytidylyltransferase n=1 Tax=Reichenbachiella agarivorans TaxID=2979464 RepID=A0ABY6CLA4_9BACT|nr:2-C-methyl-D-erythritol 4-phosphate cytidylyltransferase [Reichenbachiella agarivorans]UXP31174.1 2-C-methyl-D-erythritol 4-phosphate cytidylyltransferase [Reichenbachiella agarivorans]